MRVSGNMRALLHRLLSPDPATLLLVPAIAYFVWWGCASTAAPTLRPATPLPDGHALQVGASANASASLLNAGVGGTVFGQYRLLDDHLELGGYVEYGAVVSPLFVIAQAATQTPLTLSEQPVGGVGGGGVAARYLFDFFDDRLRVGAEVHAAGAAVFGGSGDLGVLPGTIVLSQLFVGMPASFAMTDNFLLFTDPAVGGLLVLVVSQEGVLPLPFFLPTMRLPLGAQLRLTDHVSMLVELGAVVTGPSLGPYGSLALAASF